MLSALLLLLAQVDGARLDEHRGGGALAFSPDGRWLVSHGNEGLHVWTVAMGRERALEQARALARLVPERHFAFASEGKELVLFESGRFSAWSLESGARLRSVKGPSDVPVDSLLSPEGSAFVAAGAGGVKIFDATKEKSWPLEVGDGETGSLSFSGSGERVALSGTQRGRGGWARIFETATGREVFSAAIAPPGRSRSIVIQTPPGSLSPDGKMLAVARAPGTHVTGVPGGPSAIQLWDVDSGKLLGELEGHKGQAWGAAYTSDGTRLATWGASDLVVWSVGLRKPLLSRPGMVHAAAFSPDGASLGFIASTDVLSHKERTVTVLDVEALKDRFSLPPDYAQDVSFSPDGKTIAVSSDRAIRLRDAVSGEPVKP